MENLIINSLDDENGCAPSIRAYVDTGIIEIKGEAFGYHSEEHFAPLFEWLGKYLEKPQREIILVFKMSFFNTTYSKRLKEVINLLAKCNCSAIVNWYHHKSDLDMREEGEDFSKEYNFEFNLIPFE